MPSGKQACHTCDFPPCVNPDHLFAGSQSENIIDSVLKGRHPRRARPLASECINGHSYSLLNYRIGRDGDRICRSCAVDQMRKRRAILVAEGLRTDGKPREHRHAS